MVERARGGAAAEGGTAKEDTVAGAAQQQLATKIPMQARREDMVTGMVYQRNSKVQLRGGRIVLRSIFVAFYAVNSAQGHFIKIGLAVASSRRPRARSIIDAISIAISLIDIEAVPWEKY